VSRGDAFAERAERYLVGAGHDCEQVATLGDATARLQAGGVEVLLLFGDLERQNAFLLAATCQARYKLTRVVAVVPEEDPGRAGQLEAVGVSQLVYAPCTQLDLLEAAEAQENAAPSFTGYEKVSPEELRALEALLAHDPEGLESQWLLGFAYYRAERFADAIPLLEKVVAQDGGNAQAYYYLGASHYREGAPPQALRCWEKVLEVDPSGRLAGKARERIERVQAGG